MARKLIDVYIEGVIALIGEPPEGVGRRAVWAFEAICLAPMALVGFILALSVDRRRRHA